MYLSGWAPQARKYRLVISQVISRVYIYVVELRPISIGRIVRTNVLEAMFRGDDDDGR